jgi:hypothetical protein
MKLTGIHTNKKIVTCLTEMILLQKRITKDHTISEGPEGDIEATEEIFLEWQLESIGNLLIGVHLTLRTCQFLLAGLTMVKIPPQMCQVGKTKVLQKWYGQWTGMKTGKM